MKRNKTRERGGNVLHSTAIIHDFTAGRQDKGFIGVFKGKDINYSTWDWKLACIASFLFCRDIMYGVELTRTAGLVGVVSSI
jgi:hypothetical protein